MEFTSKQDQRDHELVALMLKIAFNSDREYKINAETLFEKLKKSLAQEDQKNTKSNH